MEILTTPLSTSVPRRLGPLKESFFFCSTGTTMACDSVKLLTMHSSCTHRMHPKSGNFNSKLQKNSSNPHSVMISAFRRAILLKHQNAEKDLIVSILKRMVFDESIENALKPLTLIKILNLNEESIHTIYFLTKLYLSLLLL